MASDLSPLLTDAFTIYSESYVRIGAIGLDIVGLDNSPNQPKKINQLIESSILYSVISPSINLNDAGTAIEGITGEIATINNLLLKLKRAVGLYSIPAFPTPLTNINIELGGGDGASADETYVLMLASGVLPNARKLAVSGGILSLVDGGAGGNATLSVSLLDVGNVDVTVNPLVLDMSSTKEKLFIGSGNITAPKTLSLANVSNARRFQFNYTISGGLHALTLPATWKMSDARKLLNVWTPLDQGEYQMTGTTYDGVNWKVEIGDILT